MQNKVNLFKFGKQLFDFTKPSPFYELTKRTYYCDSKTPRLGTTVDINSPERKFLMRFTCTVCNTTSTKSFSALAYEKGVVLATCPGCKSIHLIADNLGWTDFGEEKNIEEIMASEGKKVDRLSMEDLQFVPKEPTKENLL